MLSKPVRRRPLLACFGRRGQEAVGSPPSKAPGSPLRILLAEDNPINAKITERVLQKGGYQVQTVVNGAEAVEAVAGGGFELVLMDCQMPVLDGFDATRAIRAGKQAASVVIIALTANAMKGDDVACRAAGMDDYLTKPFQPEQMYRLLEHWSHELRQRKVA